MRARNIKPAFFLNPELISLPPLTRLFFIGLWCVADREGRLEDRPAYLKILLMPGDNCDIDRMCSELHRNNFITRYDVSGKRYIQIINFGKHQNPHKQEQPSTIPAPPEKRDVNKIVDDVPSMFGSCTEVARLIPDSLIPDSLIPKTKILSDKPDPIPYKLILDDMNFILGKGYQLTEKFRKLVKARYKDGFTHAHFNKVCSNMMKQWSGDPKMHKYLRPDTLFSDKFDSYLNISVDHTYGHGDHKPWQPALGVGGKN